MRRLGLVLLLMVVAACDIAPIMCNSTGSLDGMVSPTLGPCPSGILR
jgi:hypothetical protein